MPLYFSVCINRCTICIKRIVAVSTKRKDFLVQSDSIFPWNICWAVTTYIEHSTIWSWFFLFCYWICHNVCANSKVFHVSYFSCGMLHMFWMVKAWIAWRNDFFNSRRLRCVILSLIFKILIWKLSIIFFTILELQALEDTTVSTWLSLNVPNVRLGF